MSESSCYVLLHSPLVGPASWRWVAAVMRDQGYEVLVPDMTGFHLAGAPYWPTYVDGVLAGISTDRPIQLVAHSGAGLLLPVVADRLADQVEALIFAEAALPPWTGSATLAPAAMRSQLERMAVFGILPAWSKWWGDDAMDTLVPEPGRRAAMEAELPTLPLDYFDQVVPMPDGWADKVAGSYLWFSDVYEDDATRAADHGWPISRLSGGHLHMAVDPEAVALTLLGLAIDSDKSR